LEKHRLGERLSQDAMGNPSLNLNNPEIPDLVLLKGMPLTEFMPIPMQRHRVPALVAELEATVP
jgi:hypothetical protein